MKIRRLLWERLVQTIEPGKVVILYGPRRVGKTTLLKEALRNRKESVVWFTGDSADHRRILSVDEIDRVRDVVGDARLVIVDEAQKIDRIGPVLKIIVDYLLGVEVVVSGSASLDLAQHAEQELVGRNAILTLYPLSFQELAGFLGKAKARDQLEQWLVWGGYPEAVLKKHTSARQQYLQTLIGSYLYRDMLEIAGVQRPKIVEDILKLLAFQIGGEVSVSELGQHVGVAKETVMRYLDLLEKSFVIFNVRGFSRNLRKEIYRNSRYYFWDNGVRNALINNFNPLNLRNDAGQLWENFLAVERLKRMGNLGETASTYFWRTYDRKEIDWVEERGGRIYGYEFRWSGGTIRRSVRDEFLGAYPGAQIEIIGRENFEQFVT